MLCFQRPALDAARIIYFPTSVHPASSSNAGPCGVVTMRRFRSLRQNVFFGIVPKAGDKRQGPPRDQCHSDRAIAHVQDGFVHVNDLSEQHCDRQYAWDTRLLAYQVRAIASRDCMQ